MRYSSLPTPKSWPPKARMRRSPSRRIRNGDQEFPVADHQRSDTSRERGRPRHGRSILYVNGYPLEPASGRQGTDGTFNSLKFFLNFTVLKLLMFNISGDS